MSNVMASSDTAAREVASNAIFKIYNLYGESAILDYR